jgi:hypothetical protein
MLGNLLKKADPLEYPDMSDITQKQTAAIEKIAKELGILTVSDTEKHKILAAVNMVGWREAVRLVLVDGLAPEEIALEFEGKVPERTIGHESVKVSISNYLRLIDALKKVSRSSKAKIASVLGTTTCEVQASQVMRAASEEGLVFDPYYVEKHEVAKRAFIEQLTTELYKAKANFQLKLEEIGELGRYDIVIVLAGINGKHEKRLVVEVKAGLSLDLTQIERYLMVGERLLLIRIMTRQAKLFTPEEYSDLLASASQNVAAKAERILNNQALLIPGPECYRCPVRTCPHNKTKEDQKRGLIRQEQKNFEADAGAFMRNLYPTISTAVQIALADLEVNTTNGHQ